MIGINYLKNIFISLFILFYNCGDSSEDSSSIIGPGATGEPTLAVEHQEGLSFKINTYNFPEAKYIQIFLKHDTDRLTFSESTNGSIGAPSFLQSDSSGVHLIFDLSTPISGNEEIVGLSFSGGNYNNTKIIVKNLYIVDQNDNEVTGIQYGTLCYLDKGIIDQAYNNSSEPLADWQPSGEYVWDYTFCGYIE
ncbi:MAG: hypothetical protein H8E60_02780 [Candidatus Marinimicrobia bacterium]|nr:hypothetical protein [Candidatus Neomarinimicrobiota bacterium]